MQKYYQNEPEFNGVYSRNNLPIIQDGAYVINLDQYESIGTHLIVLYVNGNNIIYFDSFGVGHIPKEIEKFIGNKNGNVSRIQAYDSIMCGYYCTGLIDFILKAKNLVNYTNYFLLMILKRMINNAKILSITKKIKKIILRNLR